MQCVPAPTHKQCVRLLTASLCSIFSETTKSEVFGKKDTVDLVVTCTNIASLTHDLTGDIASLTHDLTRDIASLTHNLTGDGDIRYVLQGAYRGPCCHAYER